MSKEQQAIESVPELLNYVDEIKTKLTDEEYRTIANSLLEINKSNNLYKVELRTIHNFAYFPCSCGDDVTDTHIHSIHTKSLLYLKGDPVDVRRANYNWKWVHSIKDGNIPTYEGKPVWEVGDVIEDFSEDGCIMNNVVISITKE